MVKHAFLMVKNGIDNSPLRAIVKNPGHTDLRIGVSRAKFGAESDFEVRLAVAPQKLGQNSEKLNFPTQKNFKKILSPSKN